MRLIDGDALIAWIKESQHMTSKMRNIICKVETMPSADRPQGEWIDEADKIDASFGIHDYRCSNCNSYADKYIGGHEWYTADKPNFCPNCGARMKGAGDE